MGSERLYRPALNHWHAGKTNDLSWPLGLVHVHKELEATVNNGSNKAGSAIVRTNVIGFQGRDYSAHQSTVSWQVTS